MTYIGNANKIENIQIFLEYRTIEEVYIKWYNIDRATKEEFYV